MTLVTSSPAASGRIVAGYDGSAGASNALTYAAALAQARETELLVVMALPHLNPKNTRTARALKADPSYIEAATAKAEAQLATLDEQLKADFPTLKFTLAIVPEDAAGTLSSLSAEAELVVVGARGASSEKRLPLLGGTSAEIITHSRGPVVVVPEGQHALDGGPVVLGLQDAPDSLAAGAIAVREAELRGVSLIALYAWDIAPELGDFGAMVRLDPEATQRDLDEMLQELLVPLLEGHPDVAVERRVVQGSARVALLEASRTASLLVIGSRGLGGFAGLLLGSISRAVTRESECPVIVARQFK
jgi:nucleotide-binding universal stress UspA family protein